VTVIDPVILQRARDTLVGRSRSYVQDSLVFAAELVRLAEPSPGHAYVSTACQHERHGECRLTCKFCPAVCGCACHAEVA
jgi:hypothetical protein